MLSRYLKIKSNFLRFVVVGTFSTLVNFLFYLFFINVVNFEVFLSSIIGYSFGLITSYHFGRTWVFNTLHKPNIRNVFLFLLVYIIGGVGMGLIIQYLVHIASIEYKLSWVVGAIFAVTNNYIGLKLYVFKKK